MRRISAPAVKKDDLVAIIAASTLLEPEIFFAGVKKLSSLGFTVTFDERILARYRSFAGMDESRAKVLWKAAANAAVRVIWCARGGYGATRILALLDEMKLPAKIRKSPKVLVGFSDATALHMYFYQKAGLRSLHAPMLATPAWQKISPRTGKIMRDLLNGSNQLGKKSYTCTWPTRWLNPVDHSINGVLLGGNLTLLTNLAGTPWQPNLKGCILFIEDCGEAPYKIDRMLTQLWNCGMLKGVKAVVAGDLSHEVKLAAGQSKQDWKLVLQDRLAARNIPVLWNAPVGHGKKNEPLPLGVRVRLTTKGKIELLEKLVR